MIKDILVNLSTGEQKRDPAAEYAIALAEMFQAHVAGIAFRIDPAMNPGAFGLFSNKIMQMAVEESEKASKRAADQFTKAARLAGVTLDCLTPAATLVGAADLFGQTARRFDLVVVGQATPQTLAKEDLLIQAALFDSGRPVIVIPYIQKAGPKFDRVALCWDGSRAAARAVADALPLLDRAKLIEVVVVRDERLKSRELAGADIAQHLARHGLSVNLAEIGHGEVDVGNTLLNYVADNSIDLLVMGGYGHSRLREAVLGGTTQTILSSMTVPTLMSH